MDDLELLQTLGEDLTEPEDRVVARARANLMSAIEASGAVPRIHRAKRRWLVAVPAVAALLVAVFVAQSVLPSQHGGPAPAAAVVLSQLANTAAGQPAQAPLVAGQYLYDRSENSVVKESRPSTGAFSYEVTYTLDQWVGTDGSGRQAVSGGAFTFPTPQDRAAWVAAGSPALPVYPNSSHIFAPGGLSFPADNSGLPTDPAALLAQIRKPKIEGGTYGIRGDFVVIGDLLRDGNLPPDVRAGLFKAAAMLEGVTNLGPMNDPLGRPGVGLAVGAPSADPMSSPAGVAVPLSNADYASILIFDSQTSTLLAQEDEVLTQQDPCTQSGGCPPVGTLTYWQAFVTSGVADSTDQRP